MNTTIKNPVAAMTPVTAKDIAAKLGKTLSAVQISLSKARKNVRTPAVVQVMKAAEEMGFKGKGDQGVCVDCGNTYTKVNSKQLICPECRKLRNREHARKMRGSSLAGGWFGGNFNTREEETARMKELREMGYSNKEIADKIGRSYAMVYNNLGKQDPILSKQNVAMSQHIRAQKNAARKQYVVNKPIREYNAKVEAHNKLKAEVARMEKELKPQTPAIEKAAQTKIDFPLVDLHTLQPTALQ